MLVFSTLFFQGCDDAIVNLYDNSFAKKKVECMKLSIFPPDNMLRDTIDKLYDFNDSCALRFEISKKGGITCNSNHNSQKKALTNFPSSYLRIQIENQKIVYSYYIDLDHDVTKQDIEDAFTRVQKDLNI